MTMVLYLVSTDPDLNGIELYLDHVNGSTDNITAAEGYYPRTSADLTKHVTDSLDLYIPGTYTQIQDKIWRINRLLQYGQENQYGPFGTWLVFAIAEGEEVWRSRVYKGLVDYDPTMYGRIRRQNLKVGLIIERDPFWEGEEKQIPICNGNGTNNITGLNVYNCNDGSGVSPNKKHNYIEIAANQVVGDLPAPVRLEMRNEYDSSARLNDVWISQNVNSNPVNLNQIIEGENASFGGSPISNTGYSAGQAQNFGWSGDTWVTMARWELNTNFLNLANKRWFKVIAAFTSSSTLSNVKLQCKITFPAGTPLTVVASSQEVSLATSRIQEIGELQIPPWLLSAGDLAPVDLTIYAKSIGGGTVGIDFLHITPLDGYRVLIPRGYGAAHTIRIVDDGINDELYTDGWTPAGKTGHYTAIGKQILLAPGKLQRLYFLQKGNTGDISTSRVLSVKAFYRPRRVGL